MPSGTGPRPGGTSGTLLRGGGGDTAAAGSALPLALGFVLLSALLLAGLATAVRGVAAAEAGALDALRRRLAIDDALARAAQANWRDTTEREPSRPWSRVDSAGIRVSAWPLPDAVWIVARHPSGEAAGLLVHRHGWPPVSSPWIGREAPQLDTGARVEQANVSPEADLTYRASVRSVTTLANNPPPSLTVLSQDLDIGAGEVVMGCWLVRGAVRLGPDARLLGRLAVEDSLVLGERAQVVGQVVMLSASTTRLAAGALIRPLGPTDADPCPELVAGTRVTGGGWLRLP
jgi:hypothetical protein